MLIKQKDGSYIYSIEDDRKDRKVYALALDSNNNLVRCWKWEKDSQLYMVDVDGVSMTDKKLDNCTFSRYMTSFDM